MNKSQALMEQMVALVLLAFAVGFVLGEELRRAAYPPTAAAAASTSPDLVDDVTANTTRKASLYSGLFLLLNRKLDLSAKQWRAAHERAVAIFAQCVLPVPVRT